MCSVQKRSTQGTVAIASFIIYLDPTVDNYSRVSLRRVTAGGYM